MARAKSNLGRQATAAEVANLVQRYPAWLLVGALARSRAWWRHAQAVADGEDAAVIARRYVPRAGPHRLLVAEMLRRAAAADDYDEAVDAMAPMIMVFGDLPLQPGEPQCWIRGAPDDEPESARPPSKRRKRDYDAWETLRLGAKMVSRRGAGLCLDCGGPLAGSAQQARRFYCFACDARLTEADRRYHTRAMTTVLRRAAFGVYEP